MAHLHFALHLHSVCHLLHERADVRQYEVRTLRVSVFNSDIVKTFSYWFCADYLDCVRREADLDFDQHELLSCVAPRLLAVGSAIDDYWACPQGEETSVRFASRAWNDPLAVHYHCRDGMHTLTPEDLAQYMDFAAAHGW